LSYGLTQGRNLSKIMECPTFGIAWPNDSTECSSDIWDSMVKDVGFMHHWIVCRTRKLFFFFFLTSIFQFGSHFEKMRGDGVRILFLGSDQ
jgi:hypothetical protein